MPTHSIHQPNSNNLQLLQDVWNESKDGLAVFQSIFSGTSQISSFFLAEANPVFIDRMGKPADELIGKRLIQLFPLPKAANFFKLFKELLLTQKSRQIEDEFINHYSRQPIRYNFTIMPLEDKVLLIIAPKIDEKQLQLEKPTQLIDQLFNLFTSGVTFFEPVLDDHNIPVDFRFVLINDVGLAMSGFQRQQLIGKTLREIYPATDSFGLFTTYRTVFLTGVAYQGEHFYPDYSVWREVSVTRVSNGLMVTYNDITYHKKLELISQQQESFLHTLFANSNALLILLNPIFQQGELIDFCIVRCNEVYAKIAGQTSDQLVQQHFSVLHPGFQETQVFEAVKQLLITEQSQQFFETCQFNGRTVWFDSTVVKVDQYILLSTLDITERYECQQTIDQLTQSLQRTSNNIQEFNFVASHDLQEPLRKIQQFGDLLKTGYGDALGDGRDYLDRMQASAQRMSMLLKALLAYSRVSTIRKPFVTISLMSVINKVIGILEEPIKQTKAHLEVENLPVIEGDVSQLEQLFEELLSNSIKFVSTGEQPNIRISYQHLKINELPPSVLTKGFVSAYHVVTVHDNGIGFESKYNKRIFGVFQQIHKGVYPGTGIGLAICQRIVENHHGVIVSQSEYGKGASFAIYLPM